VPSKIIISSVAFLVGGDIYKKDAKKAGEDMSIEDCVAECAMEIFSSIEEDFTILNIYINNETGKQSKSKKNSNKGGY